MADTVVQYVINISAQDAERSLDKLGNESKQVSNEMSAMTQETRRAADSMDHLGKETKRLERELEHTSRRANSTSKSFRNMRRAGRDLDGAFADLSQGVGLISPALGNMFSTLSDGASITEGLSRTLVGALNPAMAGVLAATALVGAAVFVYGEEQKQAEAEAKALAESIEQANKTLEEQDKILSNAAASFAGYLVQLNNARNELAVLQGVTTEYELAQSKASLSASQFGQKALQTTNEEIEAIEKKISAQNVLSDQYSKTINQITQQAESRLSTFDRLGGAQAEFTEKERQAIQIARDSRAAEDEKLTVLYQQLRALEDQRSGIRSQQKELEGILIRVAEIKKEEEDRAKRQRRIQKQQAEADKKRRDAARDQAKAEREIEQARLSALSAQQQLESILDKAVTSQLSGRDQIIKKFQDQIKIVDDLTSKSGDYEKGLQATFALLEQQTKELEDYDKKQNDLLEKQEESKKKEEEKLAILRLQTSLLSEQQNKTAEIAAQNIQEFQSQFESGLAVGLAKAVSPAVGEFAKAIQNVLTGTIDTIGTLATGSISDMVSMFAPVLGQTLGMFAEIGKKTPDERRQELLEEIQAIKAGLEFFPEIFLSILPEMALVLTEAVFDGVITGFVNAIELLVGAFQDLFSFSLFDKPPDEQSGLEKMASFLADFFNPFESATFASGGRFIPSAESGIRFTGGGDGLAMLHRGEFVVPQSGQRPQQVDRQLNRTGGGGVNIVVNSLVTEQNAIDQLVRQIEHRFNSQYGVSSSNLFGGR